jgi:hypothetical protein
MAIREQPDGELVELPDPPSDFDNRPLPVVEGTGPWYRLNPAQYDSALHFDRSGRGRFDGPQQGYGILYVGEDVCAAFIETFGRIHGAKGVSEVLLRQRNLVEIKVDRPLVLVDLIGSGLVKLGADARLTAGKYTKARRWARAIHEHPQQVDGIRYRSRHDPNRLCCGFFDRVQPCLGEQNQGTLIEQHPHQLAQILAHYDYGLL